MKLLVVTQALDRDDPILGFAHEWMRALAQRLERLIVAPLKAGTVDLPANVEVRSLGKERGAGTLGILRAFARVVGGACARREIDGILAHMVPRYAVYAAPFARPRGIPLFLWYTHKGVDWSLRLADPLVARAYTASSLSYRLDSAKKVVTGHGIDTRHFAPDGNAVATHDLVVVGRIAPAKDPLAVIEALGHLKARGQAWRALFAGGTLLAEHDAYQRDVERRVAELGLAPQVDFLGPVPHPQVRAVFLRAPFFVTPSLTGSVDKTVLEAMACGRVALTCNESFAEVFGPLASRLMFPRGDAVALADRLQALRALPPSDLSALGTKLRGLVVAEHDLDALAQRLVSDMERVAHRR